MLIKPRNLPEKMPQLEGLSRRLIPTHEKHSMIMEEWKNTRAGLKGEQSMDYFYRRLEVEKYFMLHNVRLYHQGDYFQIDTLILTPSFILILEIKNLAGELIFDHEHQQLLRISNGQKEVFADPVKQVEQQAASLRGWLRKRFANIPPITGRVVMTNTKAILATSAPHPSHAKIIRPSALRETVEKLAAHPRILQLKKTKEIATTIMQNDQPQPFCAFQKYGLTSKDIRSGAFCPSCQVEVLSWGRGKWHCVSCEETTRNAHHQALQDYAWLINTEVSSKELQYFLHLPSIYCALRLLKKMKLPHSGGTKGRKYDLSSFRK